MINAVLAKTQYRDLNGLVAALEKGGLDAQVQVLARPRRQPADHRGAVEGDASATPRCRISPASSACRSIEALKTMAQYLPDIVDKASPNGTIKPT